MASFLGGKAKVEGVGSERQDGKLRRDGHIFTCDTFEDWLVVSEARRREERDTPVKQEWPWYQGRMNRSVAEDYLSKSGRFDGTFIVRESDAISVRQDPVYMVSVLNDGVTHHVEVEKKANGKYGIAGIEGAKTFKSLKKLVEYYQKKPMDLEGGGKAKLKYSMK